MTITRIRCNNIYTSKYSLLHGVNKWHEKVFGCFVLMRIPALKERERDLRLLVLLKFLHKVHVSNTYPVSQNTKKQSRHNITKTHSRKTMSLQLSFLPEHQ